MIKNTDEAHTAMRASYLGPEGTFSYFAGKEFAPGYTLAPCPDLHAVFQAVTDGDCQIGLVPLENSLRGTVGQSFDLFLNHDLRIVAEMHASISHCLLSSTVHELVSPGSGAVRAVYSHPQPLAQCEKWLRANLPGVPMIAMESTAAAARRAAEEPGAAAVGHQRLAELYNMHILARAIEDESDNRTRFVAVSREPVSLIAGPRERTSLLFTLPDKPGSLAAVLNCLADASINMRKLESRPLRQPDNERNRENWKYAFFVDVECDMNAPEYADALIRLAGCCTMLRVLGSYPTA